MGLKIGAVSKMSGFSASGIRYLEERGIISPSLGRDGTYRSFDLPDVARLLECRNYRECGCSTEEGAELLGAGSAAEIERTLEECEQRTRERLVAAERLDAFLAQRLASLREIEAGSRGLRVTHSPTTYWAPLWMPGARDNVEARIPTEEDGFPIPFADASLLFHGASLPCREAGSQAQGAYAVGYAIQRRFSSAPPALAEAEFLPSRLCVRGIVRVHPDFSPYAEDLQAVVDYLSAQGLAASEGAFTHRICTVYQPEEIRYDELWVPVA